MVTIPRSAYDEVIEHVTGQPDEESCGIFGGADGQVALVFRARNIAETRRTRFLMDARDIQSICDQIEDAGLDLVGFYHSHTHTQAYPSPTDVADWPGHWYPDALCFICSLMELDRPLLRAFHVGDNGTITEEPISIVEG